MSAAGEPCVRCGNPLIEEGPMIRCMKCGFQARKGGAIINVGGELRPRMLKCPECGTVATEDQFEEVER